MEIFAGTLILLCFTSYSPWPASSKVLHDNSTDLAALLAFKADIVDPYGILAGSWTPNASFCSWIGVSCSPRRHRVTTLHLGNFSLQGTISPHLANLSFMTYLNLYNDTLVGSIPDALGRLSRLGYLNLGLNSLTGSIPPTIFNMSSLTFLSLSKNNLSGPLPTNQSINLLPRLQIISLSWNQLTGEIPSIFARCHDLQIFSLSYNLFSGTIPMEFPSGITVLYLANNNLTGTISAAALSNLTKLRVIELGFNKFSGRIPTELGSLPNLQHLMLTSNHLTGSIPNSLSNLSMLNFLELAVNGLTGAVPDIFRNMPYLTQLNLGNNQLTGRLDSIITPLSNNRALESLGLWVNKFEGVIPNSVGNLSTQLVLFDSGDNHIQGRIPTGFGNLTSLLELDLSGNVLQGAIPRDLTRLEKLQKLYLDGNRLDGFIPHELGRMRSLGELYLSNNRLTGLIPDTLGNISGLQVMSLAANTLSSNIPSSVWSLKGLTLLSLSDNFLLGALPLEIGNLEKMDFLNLSWNRLSDSIPSTLGVLRMLEYLDLSHNSFLGLIPESFGRLLSVTDMDLSSNALSGAIPRSLANLHYLTSLNLSFNRLEGEIPQGGTFLNFSLQSFMGNTALYGSSRLGFPPCSPTNATHSHSRAKSHLIKYILPTVVAFVLILVACVYFLRMRGVMSLAPIVDKPLVPYTRFISYHELLRATGNFSETNLLGRGSFGSVFKGCLNDGLLVAIKVLNLDTEGASQSFDVECRTLCMIRHRNLVKIISTCSNLDFRALILQFMPNGSLERWLYSHNYCLTLLQRICIMLDIAMALEYLHDLNVVHCDLKPSNVMLDEDMTAHVGDFGIAKLLGDYSKSLVSASAPGTIGYMAPEYGLAGRVSRKADVYSYGILLLETFTRKKPTDVMFSGESSLRQWVSRAHNTASILETVDQGLFGDGEEYSNDDYAGTGKFPCLLSILKLGLSCSQELSNERIPMKDVVVRLEKLKAQLVETPCAPNTGLAIKPDH